MLLSLVWRALVAAIRFAAEPSIRLFETVGENARIGLGEVMAALASRA